MFNRVFKNINAQTGWSLIEMMITVTLSSVMIITLFSLYMGSQKALNLQLAITQFLYLAQNASDILKANISHAGDIGCPQLSKVNVDSTLPYNLSASNKLIGNQAEITIRQASLKGTSIKSIIDNKLELSNEVKFKPHDILLITDCKKAEIFQVKDVVLHPQSQSIIGTQPFINQYDNSAKVRRFETNQFFIAMTKTFHGKKIYSLFKKDLIKNRKIELVENITSIQFKFSVIDQDKLVDKPHHEITDWAKVVAVSVQLGFEIPPVKKFWHLYVPINEI